ncbi:hypothetical protein [Nesterenkonia natronophila]|uniref:DUF2238 domain-containing protein n=1 Tax=Nesterenkonia natronophila TaxID=2174932 RepID=A0A3A4F4I8_9MICC|nr:hypothetical protein [Nesterenkonia natronophila]RJN32641.1 hypothetical protein D3250_02065 [Nesterenkonia natronophila]
MERALHAKKITRHTPMGTTALLMVVSLLDAVMRADSPPVLVPLLLLPTVLLPLLAEKWANFRVPASLQWQYAVLLLAGPYVGEHWGLYHLWDPWDKWVHLYSGFFIAFAIVFALGVTLRRYRLDLPPWVEAVIVISVKASVALLWEVAEFVWDMIFDTTAQDHNFDTMTDMMLGTAPGILVAAALVTHRTRRPIRYFEFLLNVPLPERHHV